MQHPLNQQRKIFYGLPFWNWLLYRIVWCGFALGRLTFFRVRSTGTENLPKHEPYLLLSNHAHTFDPLWLAERLYRPVCPMGSAQMLKIPFLGGFLKALGCFPKAKYSRDPKAMEKLQELYEQGFVVLIFPEGTRTFNGRTQNVLPGIGKLIKRMNPTVVYAVSNSAFLYQPRWARFPRMVPVEVQFDGPYNYSDDMTVEELTAEVQSRLDCTAHIKDDSSWTWGWKMAHGLPRFLWACPMCLANEGLQVEPGNGHRVTCEQCGESLEIDVECKLTGSIQATVWSASQTIAEGMGQPPVMDKEDYEACGSALRAPEVELLFWPKGGKPTVHCRGELTLGKDGLTMTEDGKVTFQASLEDLHAFSIDLGDKFFFRVKDEVFEFRSEGESIYKWHHFLRKWKLEVAGAEF
jgi:1-acyl-sn-glycerol-3-phosphate acyltransferase